MMELSFVDFMRAMSPVGDLIWAAEDEHRPKGGTGSEGKHGPQRGMVAPIRAGLYVACGYRSPVLNYQHAIAN